MKHVENFCPAGVSGEVLIWDDGLSVVEMVVC
jgi:hypothetical protein